MTASTSERRSFLRAAALSVLLLLTVVAPGVRGVEPTDVSNRLESPMVDLAILPVADGGTTPRMLVLDATPLEATSARVEVLERGAAWRAIASAEIELGSAELGARWLVGLDPTRFALIATDLTSEPSRAVRAIVVTLRVDLTPSRVALVETGRRTFERAIDDSGAPDVEGDGQSELLLHFRAGPVGDRPCLTSDLTVLETATLQTVRDIALPGPRLGGGVTGQWDTIAGDDLLAYAAVECPLHPDREGLRLLAVRLRDGETIRDLDLESPRDRLASLGPPLRIDLDAVAPDEAVAQTAIGLSILDPSADWGSTQIGSGSALPLVAGADADAQGGARRIAWMEPGPAGRIATQRLRRGADDAILGDRESSISASEQTPMRWELIGTAARQAAARYAPAAAWIGDALEVDCPDLIVPAAILPCGDAAFRTGAAWLATRPVAVMSIEGRRRLLVAAGLGWEPQDGLPAAPAPMAAGPAGWWRHGPSVPFALSEVRARDAAYFRDFPTPRASVDKTTAADATTILPGFTGTRLFVTVAALQEGEEGPDPATERTTIAALGPAGVSPGSRRVVRVPVGPGLESGRDGSFALLSLADVTLPDGVAAGQWSMRVVPINDWGEAGQPSVGVVSSDTRGPTLFVMAPFVSPIWPFTTHLTGGVEPGLTILLEGIGGTVDIDRRGRISIETTLAPWPQTVRISATDAAGNRTVHEVSVIGGIDYRRLPWALLLALGLLLIVAVRGLGADGAARAVAGVVGAGRWSTSGSDDGPMPEIEELPPGAGLPRL